MEKKSIFEISINIVVTHSGLESPVKRNCVLDFLWGSYLHCVEFTVITH